jgi:hypothetical protein
MRKLRIVLRYLSLFWRHRNKHRPTEYPTPSVDSEEFSNLLRSGRKEDMETLAKRLSRRPRSPA